jgi:hypothetical protein
MVSSPEQPTGDDTFWRRPEGDTVDDAHRSPPDLTGPGSGPTGPVPTAYAGPPRTYPPPHGWQPPRLVQPPPPRALPPQDPHLIDRTEQAAKTVTTGIGLVASAVLIVLLLVLCGRWLF